MDAHDDKVDLTLLKWAPDAQDLAGLVRHWRGAAEGARQAHNDTLQLLLVASDVTEQRAAEQARFDAAVSQREMLVKEVHHRIKNNLQGVAGLLQQTAARRPEVAALISEAVGQVQAIAQVHGLQVGVSGPLRIQPLVEAITASVQRTFGRPITVSVEGTPAHRFALPEAESIPIALTVNFAGPVGQGPITARARPARTNRSTQHWWVELVQTDADGSEQVSTTATVVTTVTTRPAVRRAIPRTGPSTWRAMLTACAR